MGTQPETVLQNRIRLAISSICRDCTIFRNHCGALKDGRTNRLVTFGLSPGSPDLVGWKSVEITPDMVGSRVAVFCGIEIKTPSGTLRDDQANWLHRLADAGGITGVARSVEDAISILTARVNVPQTD